MSWVDTRLKHLCMDTGQYGLNLSADQYSQSGVRLIRTSDISSDGSLSAPEDGVHVDVVVEPRHRLRPGDVLLSRSGTLGRSFLVPHEANGQTFAGFLIRFRPRSDVDPRFLYYATQSLPFQEVVHSEAVASTIQNFNAERYSNIALRAPGVAEQRRIADFLDAETARIDRLSGLQQQVMRLLDERESAQLDLAIDDLVGRHGTVPLRRFLWGVDQGSSPQCEAVPAGDDEWGVLKVSCLRPGLFLPHENKRLPEREDPDRTSEVRDGDLLITRANTPQLVGSTAVVHKVRRKLLLSDKIFRVRLSHEISPEFVATVARGSRIRALCAASSNGASQSMANIRFEEVKAWPLPAIGLDLQRDLVERISRGRAQLDALRPKANRQLDLLAERRQALITATVTGQFDVSTASGRNVTDGVTA
ncbi:restriction endonuclease subunit S [Streptomyces sp. NPDC048564]|uniref:restriction endonuclease subunit S n=1 Tax=Streptomyces sp. NPDC048564 TaxID=3155760 RepID=UPI003418F917